MAPTTGFSSTGETTSTEPIFEASGQAGAAGVKLLSVPPSQPICASEHPCSPDAEAGFGTSPAGSVTVSSRSGGVASDPKCSFCGSCSSTAKPVALSASLLSGCTLNAEGTKLSRLHPVTGALTAGVTVPPFGHSSPDADTQFGPPTSGSPCGVPFDLKTPGASQESKWTALAGASPEQSAGLVNIATRVLGVSVPSRAPGSPKMVAMTFVSVT